MSLLTRLRRVARALPLGRPALNAARKMSATGFELSAFARHGWSRKSCETGPGAVVVAGFHGSVLGLGDGVRAFSAALRRAGIEVIDWDVAEVFGHDRPLAADELSAGAAPGPPPGEGPMIIHLNPRELVQLAAVHGRRPFAGRRVIGYWAWELEQAPRSWAKAVRYVDEVWTPSQFVADAVRTITPEDMPVRVFPHLVSMLPAAGADRTRFGLPQDRFVALTSFDMRSGFVRKNPFAAIEAVRRAAELSGAPVTLACKVVGREGAPHLYAQLEAEAAKQDDVRLITEGLTGPEMASLIASADAVITLHRSEGFGLLPAQAMLAGKAVVATGWSGNLDFMDAQTARLVDYDLVPVEDVQGLYAGGHWAEPDVDDAARKLARLIEFPGERAALGAAAQQGIRGTLDPDRWGAIAKAWLGRA